METADDADPEDEAKMQDLMDFFSPDDDIFDDEADRAAATIDSPTAGGDTDASIAVDDDAVLLGNLLVKMKF